MQKQLMPKLRSKFLITAITLYTKPDVLPAHGINDQTCEKNMLDRQIDDREEMPMYIPTLPRIKQV